MKGRNDREERRSRAGVIVASLFNGTLWSRRFKL